MKQAVAVKPTSVRRPRVASSGSKHRPVLQASVSAKKLRSTSATQPIKSKALPHVSIVQSANTVVPQQACLGAQSAQRKEKAGLVIGFAVACGGPRVLCFVLERDEGGNLKQ